MAISAPEQVKAAITALQTELRPVLPAAVARWARPEQCHITLRFLGRVLNSRINELAAALTKACRSFAQLRLRAAGLGYFPNARIPRVLWVGVTDEARHLPPLWKAVQDATQLFTAEPPEKAFVAHLTVARLNRLRRVELQHLSQALAKFDSLVLGEWTASHLELMQSELSPTGARYSSLASLPLAG